MDRVLERDARCLMSRLEPEVFGRIAPRHREKLDYDPVSRAAYLNWIPSTPDERPQIEVV